MKSNILKTIGNTPLIKIGGIHIKLETTNATGSIKDRMALYLLQKSEQKEEIKKGDTIIEATSGNTGIAFAMLSAVKGYKFIAVMPESMSVERRRMIEAYGGKIILTPAEEDVAGALKKYQEILKTKKNVWTPKQFENPDNAAAHREGLGKEILKEVPKIDAFIAGTGTGGTLIGVAQALKRVHPQAKIIAVEPAESAVLSGDPPGLHKIQGIGEGFVPKLVKDNIGLIDEVITIKSKDAIKMSKILAKKYGVLVGISSGANFLASLQAKKRFKNVVTVFPDRGERYLSAN